MLRQLAGKALALMALAGFLGVTDVANGAAGAKLSGTVVNARNGKGVNRARVKLAAGKHHHKHKHVKKGKKGKKGLKGKGKVHAAHAGRGGAKHSALTAKNGNFTFSNVGPGMVTVVAHKRGVGTGRAHIAAGSGNFAITLHKRHHGHSGIIKHAAKVKHKKLGRRKAGVTNSKKLNTTN